MPRAYAIRDWNATERSFRIVASTANPVRCSEVGPDGQPVEFLEALEGWNTARFEKNPIILESHDADDIDAGIGLGSELKQLPDGGLEMKVTLAPVSAAPRTAELEQKIQAGILRGVSVGFDYGARTDEQRNGQAVRVYRNNILNEVSLCLIPKDEDALVVAQTDEERAKARVSSAGKLLAASRQPRTDAADEDSVNRFDFIGSVGKFERTQVGGLRIPARLTRTGVLQYRRPDGSIRRELRHPEEVFNSDSLATLAGATVTDLEHHRGLLNVHNWKDATLGHAEEVRQDGKFVEADLVINDARAIADVENGRLHDISCGYSCRLDAEPGVWNGEPYDVIQRRIRYNHVAVLPKGKGRAGTDVALRLDSNDAELIGEDESNPMAEVTKRVIRIDGKDLEYGSEQHIKHIEDAHLADLAKHEKTVSELQTRCDAAEGKAAACETRAKKAEADLESEKNGEEARARRKTRERLLRRAIRALITEEEDEEKMDALDEELTELSDKEIMLRVLRADAAYADDKDLDGKPEPYIQALFDGLTKKGVTRTDGIDSVVKTVEREKRRDTGGAKDPLVDARRKMNERAANAWKQPLT